MTSLAALTDKGFCYRFFFFGSGAIRACGNEAANYEPEGPARTHKIPANEPGDTRVFSTVPMLTAWQWLAQTRVTIGKCRLERYDNIDAFVVATRTRKLIRVPEMHTLSDIHSSLKRVPEKEFCRQGSYVYCANPANMSSMLHGEGTLISLHFVAIPQLMFRQRGQP